MASLQDRNETIFFRLLRDHTAERILEGLEDRVEKAMWYPDYVPVRYRPHAA